MRSARSTPHGRRRGASPEPTVIDIDGARVLFPEGWGLIRASNTQPALVLRAEAKDPAALERIKRSIEEALSRFPEVAQPRW